MSKSNHFFGQPLYGQLINLLDKEKILELSRSKGGERYIKRFDAWTHLVTMLYAVIMRHDSLREILIILTQIIRHRFLLVSLFFPYYLRLLIYSIKNRVQK
mgnify:CR=1 FL=1